jgi:antitoxin component YwqK of YwqJK toxin-antitoxin module
MEACLSINLKMKIQNLFAALFITIGLSTNFQAQIAVSKILVLPQSEFYDELWFKLSEPAFPEPIDTFLNNKNRIKFIQQRYSDGSSILSFYNRKGELAEVVYSSKEDNIRVSYHNGLIHYVLPKKWGISDSTLLRYDYIRHGQILQFKDDKIQDVWQYKYGRMESLRMYENEKLKEKQVYMNGYKDYMRIVYFDNGKVLSSVRLVDGKTSGKSNFYFKEGEPLGEFEFQKGKLLKGKIHKEPTDTEGTIISSKDLDAVWYHCAPDGSFCCECHARKGKVKCKSIKSKN